MTNEVNSESSAAEPGSVPKARPKNTRAKKSVTSAEGKEPAAKKRTASLKAHKSGNKKEKSEPAEKAAPKKRASTRRKAAAIEKAAETAAEQPGITPHFEDPIGDVSDGEAWTYTGEVQATEAENEAEAYRAGVAVDAVDGTLQTHEPGAEAVELAVQPAKIAEEVAKGRAREDQIGIRAPVRLERLQKILSQAGIASRRHAEEMIVAGRVAVNGQVVTALGSKADPERDHIRVDGKLLHGAERHRYFILNKPKGYVTTVSDPQGRPTVMEFVQRLGERVYPVGRLDFQSEGLLLMTNDGALANQLTHASSGVEKTYLVKIAGQPDEEQLDRLRSGVMIERGGRSDSGLYGPGGRVRTAPAQIRQIRPGPNPWYEVVLTEGRNRELRKMFSAIGHYVEKIRRVGYGPLVLDLEPGTLRELSLEEVDLLRQTAEGKLKPRRLKTETMLPKEAGRSAESRPTARGSGRVAETRPAKPYRERRPERSAEKDFRRRGEGRSPNRDYRPREEERSGGKDLGRRGEGRFGGKQFERRGERPLGAKKNQSDRRGEVRFEAKERLQREVRGERREWQPRGERPVRRGEEPGRRFEGRRDARGGESESREFQRRPEKRWDRGAGERSFRDETRPAESRGHDRFGEGSKPGGKGRFGGFGAERGRSGFGNRGGGLSSDRGRGGFSAKSKSGGFGGERGGRGPGRSGARSKPGGFRPGPRPGGRPSGGKRRG